MQVIHRNCTLLKLNCRFVIKGISWECLVFNGIYNISCGLLTDLKVLLFITFCGECIYFQTIVLYVGNYSTLIHIENIQWFDFSDHNCNLFYFICKPKIISLQFLDHL